MRIVEATPWLLCALATVRDAKIPEAYVAAGAIRDTVWDAVLGRSALQRTADVDVIYFDASTDERDWCRALQGRMPEVEWEVTNQATVHRWQSQVVGRSVPAYSSVFAALG